MFKKTDEARDRFLETARVHLGYRAQPGMMSYYGGTVGYQGLPWDGAFIDVVAREAGVPLTACVYSPTALAEFVSQRRLQLKPRPGDIVFYTFSTGEDFGMPHVGIVTDVTGWEKFSAFKAIEAQVSSGLAKGGSTNDGVFERTRYRHEVIGFGRPDFRVRPAKELPEADGRPGVKLSQLRPGKRYASIERVQLALGVKCGLRNAARGTWDGQTASAYARWQRMIGYTGKDVTGIPDSDSLERLGRETGYFRVTS
jgi:hypothetical protein